jgi:hypothetical protein
MTETVWIVLIVAVVIVLLAFRERLKTAAIEIVRGKKVKASMTAQPAADATVPGANKNLMAGANEIDLVEGSTAGGNTMLGKNKITTRSSAAPAGSKSPPT